MLVSMGLESVLSKGTSLALCCLSPLSLPQVCPGTGTGGQVEAGAPTGPDRTTGHAGTCHKGYSQRQGCGCLQLGLQTDTSLTFNPGPAWRYLAPLPFGLKLSPVQFIHWRGSLSAFQSPQIVATTGTESKKVKKGWYRIDMKLGKCFRGPCTKTPS